MSHMQRFEAEVIKHAIQKIIETHGIIIVIIFEAKFLCRHTQY